ncbi:MAG TPA: cell division protein ZipA C-terminal FtsZ-binding domain-containing protein [Cyclobacteriaceae bacterium]
MKYIIIVVLILIIVSIVWIINKRKKATDTIVFVPSNLSDDRVAKLNLRQNLDPDLGILDEKKINFPPKKESIENDDYRGVPELEWIIDVTPPAGFHFKKDKFLEVFDYNWRTNFESDFYAYFPDTKSWSFAIAGDSPEQFDSLELAVNLASPYREEEKELTTQRLNAYLGELKKRLDDFHVKMNIQPRESPEKAVQRSRSLRLLQKELGSDIVVVLQSDSKFKSSEFWNTLVDLGLKWGDGDLFHWRNENGIGDENFYSVWTTTEPGYFLPEDILTGKINPQNLIFGFSIARSADPLSVYEMMMQSVMHCQSKLGGTILDENGVSFDKAKYKNRIEAVTKKMSENGLDQGQGITLRLIW